LDITYTAEWRQKEAENLMQCESRWHTQQLDTILTWLETGDSAQESKLEILNSRCYDGTCQWITQSAKIRSWLQRGRGGSVLWLNGMVNQDRANPCWVPGSFNSFDLIQTGESASFLRLSHLIVGRQCTDYAHNVCPNHQNVSGPRAFCI
jgi:hypothetical protein